MKKCTKCGETKLISDFNKSRSTNDRLQYWCKSCCKKYNQDHKKEHCECTKRWNRNHPECMKRWHKNNPGYMKQYAKWWQKDNRDKCNRYKQRRRAKMKNLPYDLSDIEWAFTRTLFENKCAYCEEPILGSVHHEHIVIPENGGGFVFGNIVPACENCNKSKFQKDVYVWMEEKGFNIQKFKDRLQIIEFMKMEQEIRMKGDVEWDLIARVG